MKWVARKRRGECGIGSLKRWLTYSEVYRKRKSLGNSNLEKNELEIGARRERGEPNGNNTFGDRKAIGRKQQPWEENLGVGIALGGNAIVRAGVTAARGENGKKRWDWGRNDPRILVSE